MKQSGLDFETDLIDFNLAEGTVVQLYKQFYPLDHANSLFDSLLTGIDWVEEEILLFDKWLKVPRLMCWYGDADAHYRYSGVTHIPKPWLPELFSIKNKLERQCRCDFNSVLANLYRDGNDSMGCHADNEKELGDHPTIASLSLGDERLFKLQHKKTKQRLNINLAHGDLLVMGGTCQRLWVHSVPKTTAQKSPRINLTFRKIISRSV